MPEVINTSTEPTVIRAVHDNPGVSIWYASQLRAVLQEALTDAVLMVGVAWNQTPPTAGIAMDAPSFTRNLNKALKSWGDKWRGKFDQLSGTLAAKFANRSFGATEVALKSALKDAGFTVSFRPTKKSLESFNLVVADNVGLIRNLQASFYSQIQQDVWSSVRAGGDMGQLSLKLQRSYGVTEKRAELISRDQNIKAKAVIETARRQEIGIKQAIWQHSSGGREPRPVHVAWGREGKMFDLDKGLYDPDEGEYVFPGQLINCRCTSRAVIPGIDPYRKRK